MISSDGLDDLLASLDMATPDVEDVTTLDDFDLVTAFNELTAALTGQLIHQDNDDAREKHSRRGAVVVEMKARGLL